MATVFLKTNKTFSKPQLAIFLLAFSLVGFLIYKSFAAPNPNLPGDLNSDNTVNIQDLSILLSNYNSTNTSADINTDGTVNVLDMSILLSHYGQSYSGGATGSMMVGLNANGVGTASAQDAHGAVNYARVDTAFQSQYGGHVSDFINNGVKVLLLIPGPYLKTGGPDGTGGVRALDANSWAADALNTWKTACASSTQSCPVLEILNEPSGFWFWGTNSANQANATAYATLIATTWNTFHNALGANSPKLIAAYENSSWWNELKAANPNISNFVDGWTVHPYGQCSTSYSAQGDRTAISTVNTSTGKHVYVTEVGWPTAVGQGCTGDSAQWTEAQQADNIYNFVQWARTTNYVDAVFIYDFHDDGGNALYGVERTNGTKKPSYNTLKCAAQSLAESC